MGNQKHLQLEEMLLDDLELSPIQKYIKHKQFPWAPVLSLCLVFVTTLYIQADVLGPKAHQRDIQIFFNYHILEHTSFDIYEGQAVFCVRTEEYSDLKDLLKFWQRTIKIVGNINEYNFYQANQTDINTTKHRLTKYMIRKQPESINLTLKEMSERLVGGLKEQMEGLAKMEVVMHISNLTEGVRNLDLFIWMEVLQGFQVKVTLDVKYYNQTFTEQNRNPVPSNLQIRKVPSIHHEKYSPYNVGSFFRLLIIMLSFQAGLRRATLYKQHPFCIKHISEGEPWNKLPFGKKCKIVGYWEIVVVLLNIIGATGSGLGVFTAWVQLVRYLEYTENPYIITLLTKNILRVVGVVLLTLFFVITGFVLLSMVLFTYTNKFQHPERAYFSYLFNNYQYGIYENFMAIARYGRMYQVLYFVFCFYMVWCINNIIPSILCNTVINKNRLTYIKGFFKEIRIPCPVCHHITNEEAEKAVKKSYGLLSMFVENAPEADNIVMKIESPKILPFLSPKLLPASRTNIRERQPQSAETERKTVFQVKEVLQMKLNQSSTQLYIQKIELFRKKIEQSLLELDIFGERGHDKEIKNTLMEAYERIKIMRMKVGKAGLSHSSNNTYELHKSDIPKEQPNSKEPPISKKDE